MTRQDQHDKTNTTRPTRPAHVDFHCIETTDEEGPDDKRTESKVTWRLLQTECQKYLVLGNYNDQETRKMKAERARDDERSRGRMMMMFSSLRL